MSAEIALRVFACNLRRTIKLVSLSEKVESPRLWLKIDKDAGTYQGRITNK